MAKDCPQGGGGITCHNCGKDGHMRKDCDQPRDCECRTFDDNPSWEFTGPNVNTVSIDSKMQCSNCQEFGHGFKRCPQPPAEESQDGQANDSSWGQKNASGNNHDSWGNNGLGHDAQLNAASDGW